MGFIAALLMAASALAAGADPYLPSGSLAQGLGTLQGEGALSSGEGPLGSVTYTAAEDLVVYAYNDGREDPMLGTALGAWLHGGYEITSWRIEAMAPIYPYVDAPWFDVRGVALGDLRVQARRTLYTTEDRGFAFALMPRIGLPTGARIAPLSRGIAGSLVAVASGDLQHGGWLTNVGITGSPGSELEGVSLGSTLDFVVGGWVRPADDWRFGAEADLHLGLATSALVNHVAAGHLFAQTVPDSGLSMTVGAGMGLIRGVGAPEYRLTASLAYANLQRDKDRDGLVDDRDTCPVDPEDIDGWEDEDGCPDLDNDLDGLADVLDTCPVDPEDLDGFKDQDGCPDLDNDGDGVVDTADECPLIAGHASFDGCPDVDGDGIADADDTCPVEAGPKATDGCPDRDGDGVADFRDVCPDEAIAADADPASSDGCPSRVYITGEQIVITEKVHFDSGRATIKAESHGLLDDVATVFLANERIREVEVAGHTDNKGSEEMNLELSAQRAAAVRDYLVDSGVAAERLTSSGYGEAMPVDTNRTAPGRARNRRVEFTITAQDAVQVPEAPEIPEPILAPAPKPVQATPWVGSTDGGSATPGFLTVRIVDVGWADVYIDDVRLSRAAPFTKFPVDPGTHVITVVSLSAGMKYEETVQISSGAEVVVTASPSGPDKVPWGEGVPVVAPLPGGSDGDPWGAGVQGPAPDSPWAEGQTPPSDEAPAEAVPVPAPVEEAAPPPPPAPEASPWGAEEAEPAPSEPAPEPSPWGEPAPEPEPSEPAPEEPEPEDEDDNPWG